MAWRSSGSTNDEMVNNLKRFGVISTSVVERGFRNVDRKFFVPMDREDIAHADQPLKEGNIHISAPHIYGSSLEALELRENSSLSFLNVGSGTGYLSCIVAAILGPNSTNYGVEIHQDVVDHSEHAIWQWKGVYAGKVPDIQIVHGNALRIAMDKGEALIGFDRIYVGASVERRDLSKLTALLKPGGILVGPVGDELVKIVRFRQSSLDGEGDDLSPQVLSGVRFAALLQRPAMQTVLPSRVWNPLVHHYYPETFRRSSKTLLLCSQASYIQPLPLEKQNRHRVNLAATLPPAIWMEILSYTHRNWFEPPQSDETFLRQRLVEEQENARKAHQARMEAEARCHIAERERDVYRLLARRWQSRLQALLQQQRQSGDSADSQADIEDEAIILNGRESAVIFGLGAMLRAFQSDSDEDTEDDDVRAMEAEEINEEGNVQEEIEGDVEPPDHDNYVFLSDEEEGPGMQDRSTSMVEDSPTQSSSKSLILRHQVRTVSISSDDL